MILSEAIQVSNEILNSDTQYFNNKKLIKGYFNCERYNLDSITKQLVILDSMYSTNMSKRYYGIEEIAERILGLGKGTQSISKESLKTLFLEYLNNSNSDNNIVELLNMKYGYQKNGDKRKAISLITKYMYFVTDFNFPIYDNLVKEYHKSIVEIWKLNVPKMKSNVLIEDYIRIMASTLKEVNINTSTQITYDELDGLIWLFGKISKNSTSLILNKAQFIKLLQNAIDAGLNFDDYFEEICKNELTDDIKHIMGAQLCKMIEFIHLKA